MADRTALTPLIPKGPYDDVSANALDFTFAAADPANGNAFTFTGRELILVQNTHATDPGTVTFTSAADPYGRTKDVSAYSLAAGEFAAFWAGAMPGWKQSDGKFYISGSAATIKIAVLRIPD